MNALLPSAEALVPFVSVENMMRLIHHAGLETVLRELADRIEADFRRWESFDKTPRLASPFARRRDRTHADFGRVGVQL